MRLIGLVLSMAAIVWVLYQLSGGDDAETIIPVEHQRALDTAKGLEQSMQDAAKRSMEEAEKQSAP